MNNLLTKRDRQTLRRVHTEMRKLQSLATTVQKRMADKSLKYCLKGDDDRSELYSCVEDDLSSAHFDIENALKNIDDAISFAANPCTNA